jgi:hypothetical protein
LIVGVGSAVYLIAVFAVWAALALAARFEQLAQYDLVERYVSPGPSVRVPRRTLHPASPRRALARRRAELVRGR